MAAEYGSLLPPYPVYSRQRYDGNLPPPSAMGPPDLRPSGAPNPYYSVYAGSHGRFLAGLNGVQMQSADPGIKDYPNELDLLSRADDFVGNGVFDPAGTAGNIHPDYGIFADHESLPGYVARDQFYTPSEVVDATTGGQVMYVPSGAVSIDDAQRKAFNDLLLWEIPPGVNPYPRVEVPEVSRVIPYQSAWPIGQDEPPDTEAPEPASPMKIFLFSAVGGVAIGLFAALMSTSKKG